MFAVIKTGGKQYKVHKDDVIAVEKLNASGGDKVQFNSVLLTGGDSIKIGEPLVKGAGVQALVLEQMKSKKVISFVKRRRKSSSKTKKGHRQQLTLIKITDILSTGAEKTNVAEAVSGKGLEINYSEQEKKAATSNLKKEAKSTVKKEVKKEAKSTVKKEVKKEAKSTVKPGSKKISKDS